MNHSSLLLAIVCLLADHDLGFVPTRLGPFEQKPDASSIQINGNTPDGVSVEHNGDSWWARFKMNITRGE